MALNPILDLTDDVEPYFGISCCDNSDASKLLQMIARWTESQARKWVGHGISQNTYTNEYHRRRNIGYENACDVYELIGDRFYQENVGATFGQIIKLDNAYARSVVEVRVDVQGNFGASGKFGIGTIQDPSSYYLEMDTDGLCKSGHLIRSSLNWPNSPGSVRVSYVSGFTSVELNTDYSFIKQALLQEMRGKFNCAWSQRGATSASGVKKKEIYHGDYTVEYQTSEGSSLGELSESTKYALSPIMSVSL